MVLMICITPVMPIEETVKHGWRERGERRAMCGRYASTRGRQELVDFFGVDGDAEDFEPDYNVAPTKPVPVVLTRPRDDESAVRELHLARWGLVPFWAKDTSIGARMINARVETAHEKPAFRRAFGRRRCIVPADGYYEWQTGEDGGKQPHFIRPADGGVLAMAGLYEVWRSPDAAGGRLLTCTILTTAATDDVGRIHDRMPMLVEPGVFDAWLDPGLTGPDEVRSLLVPAAEGRLASHPVSTAVNKVANNGPDLVRPLPEVGISSSSPHTLF
jgi:putative SOS response-associated peptidase YedK